MAERVLHDRLEVDVDECANRYGISPCTAGRVESGTAQGGAASSLTLRAAASAVDDAYNLQTLALTAGPGSPQERRISDYVGASRLATVASPWRVNRMPYSAQLDQWGGVATVTVDQGVDDDGATKLDRLEDDDAAAYENRSRSITVPNDSATYEISLSVLKDLAATQRAGLNISLTGGTPVNVNARFALDGTNVASCTVYDAGDRWRVVISITNNASGNTSLSVAIYPATSTTKGGGDTVTAVGSMTCGRVHVRASTEHDEYIETGAAAIALPDNTTSYDVIDRPNACYQVIRTCQDRANYVKGTRTIKFCGAGSPIPVGQLVRPYIRRVERAATKLDPEQGLAVRSSSSVLLRDDTGTDVELDPYVRDRATPAQGTYWGRFFARVRNYAGRPARLVKQYVDRGSFGTELVERFIVDSVKGPTKSGEVSFVLKDATKLLDKTKAPLPTSGKLAIALGPSDMQLTLGTGQGAQYAAAGYVRVGSEVIRYDGNAGDVLSWSSSTYRGQFGTEGAAAKLGANVQQCLVYVDQAYSDVIQNLYNLAGILDADIDLAGLQNEDAVWLGLNYRITAAITTPETIATLVKELLKLAQAMAWWSAVEQKHKFKVFAPASPTAVVAKTLDDVGYLVDRSVDIERLESSRITLSAIYYGLLTATENATEPKNYSIADLTIDADAESSDEYDGRIVQTMFSRWFDSQNELAMRALSQRQVARYRDAPENVKAFSLDPKDADIVEGQIVDMQTEGLVNFDGSPRTARLLITSRDDAGTHVEYSARVTTFDRRYGFIAPAGTSDYPNNGGYACVSSAAGLMNDGTEGYLVI